MLNAQNLLVCIAIVVKLVSGLRPNQPYQPHQPEYTKYANKFGDDVYHALDPKPGEYFLISTSISSRSFSFVTGNWSQIRDLNDSSVDYLEIDQRRPYDHSTFIGFGVTFTDSDRLILKQMTQMLRERVLKSYFSPKGLNFDLVLIQIKNNFDFQRKIHIKRMVDKAFKRNLKVFAALQTQNSSTNHEIFTNSTASFSKYANFLNPNQIWSIFIDLNNSKTPQNVTEQANYLDNLLTNLNKTTHKARICLMDDSKSIKSPWLEQLEEIRKGITQQISMVCLKNDSVPPEMLCRTYRKYHKPILFANSAKSSQFNETFDSWQRAENLIKTLMQLLHQNIEGYFEKNLISIDSSTFSRDSFIVVDEKFSGLKKQPAFYVMSHFSRYILPGSTKIDAMFCGPNNSNVQAIAFRRPDAKIAILLHNLADQSSRITLFDKRTGEVKLTLKPKSINTIVYSISM